MDTFYLNPGSTDAEKIDILPQIPGSAEAEKNRHFFLPVKKTILFAPNPLFVYPGGYVRLLANSQRNYSVMMRGAGWGFCKIFLMKTYIFLQKHKKDR